MSLVSLLVTVVFVEAITEVVTESKIMSPVRQATRRVHDWLGDLFECGFCFSLWVSMVGAAMVRPDLGLPVVAEWAMTTTLLFRCSHVLHDTVNRVTSKIPFLLSVQSLANAIEAHRPVGDHQGSGVDQ